MKDWVDYISAECGIVEWELGLRQAVERVRNPPPETLKKVLLSVLKKQLNHQAQLLNDISRATADVPKSMRKDVKEALLKSTDEVADLVPNLLPQHKNELRKSASNTSKQNVPKTSQSSSSMEP